MEPNMAFQKWAEAYKVFEQSGEALMWPNETLIRLFKGPYIPEQNNNYEGKQILDMGFGCANNLVFLGSLGLQLHGVEIDQSICDSAKSKLAMLGHASDLKVGTNRNIPFSDNYFDFLVSWNVIHYENNEDDMRSAIKEYARVLKPGGRLFLSTTGPEHKILANGKTLGNHRYQIGREDDFRKGEVYFYFDAPNYLEYYFGQDFSNLKIGRTHDHFFNETLDWWIITGIKEK